MTDYLSKHSTLSSRIKLILNNDNLDTHRLTVVNIANELAIDTVTLAAALIHLSQTNEDTPMLSLLNDQNIDPKLSINSAPLSYKMVRYRLDIGSQHLVTLEQLKITLVEESGVDKNNINNIKIQSLYTLIDLPDEMPADIFQHLKSVEINQRKLDIRRVKARNNKKRGNNHLRRNRTPNQNLQTDRPDQVNCNKTTD